MTNECTNSGNVNLKSKSITFFVVEIWQLNNPPTSFLKRLVKIVQFLGVLVFTNDYLKIFLHIYLYMLNFIMYRHQAFSKHFILLV